MDHSHKDTFTGGGYIRVVDEEFVITKGVADSFSVMQPKRQRPKTARILGRDLQRHGAERVRMVGHAANELGPPRVGPLFWGPLLPPAIQPRRHQLLSAWTSSLLPRLLNLLKLILPSAFLVPTSGRPCRPAAPSAFRSLLLPALPPALARTLALLPVPPLPLSRTLVSSHQLLAPPTSPCPLRLTTPHSSFSFPLLLSFRRSAISSHAEPPQQPPHPPRAPPRGLFAVGVLLPALIFAQSRDDPPDAKQPVPPRHASAYSNSSPTLYDTTSLAASAIQKPDPYLTGLRGILRILWRTLHLASIYLPLLLTFPVWYYFNRSSLFHDPSTSTPPRRTTLNMVAGQWLSSRSDVIAPEVCEVLARLQSLVVPHGWRETREAVEGLLGGRRLEEVFGEFDVVPVGVGAVAQVRGVGR
ncbi:hypothetical protein BDK51DRAFT_38748 [Blyttiomyces helicus]|uniref:Uncharacterized protein n=1 Tax=Blyttiomyces helicus TaxID=388810 RepID=A0A4P9WHM7_9FUNG|nr:hypothetical protein BDK51DRAFT_38748 [Blyttiomyces helicus]|eukprot:RKO90046.1 hypothetical protein BDK51DRAFT_38748 [Blyttiomyces helicus]